MSDSFTTRDAIGWGVLLLGMGGIAYVLHWGLDKWDKVTSVKAVDRLEARWEKEASDDEEFYASATRLPATVVSSSQMGQYNLRPLLELRLRIEAPEGPFEVDVEHSPQAQYAHRYGEGCKIHVYVDPKREHVKCAAWESADDSDER